MVDIWYPERENGRERGGDRPRAPLAFLRKIKETILEEEPERVIFSEEGIGRVEMESLGGSLYRVKFGFHENNIEHEFRFRPMGVSSGGGVSIQGLRISELGGRAGEFGGLFEEEFDTLPLEFSELNAASKGHENLTDYEFQYDGFVDLSNIRQSNF